MTIDQDTSTRITMIRFPMIVGVVFGHTYNSLSGLSLDHQGFPQVNELAAFLQYYISRVLTGMVVPLFFMTAAYLLFSKYDGSLEHYRKNLVSRTRTLFVPFVFWNVLTLLVLAIAQAVPATAVFFSGRNPFIASFGPWQYADALFGVTQSPISFQFWFVRDLMLLMILAPLFFVLARWPALFVVGVPVLAWIAWMNPFRSPSVEAVIFFSVGALFGRLRLSAALVDPFWKAILLLYALLSFADAFTRDAWFNEYVHYAGMPFGIAAVYWLAGIVYRSPRVSQTLAALAATTFFVFATHEPLQSVITKLSYAVLRPEQGATLMLLYLAVPLVTTAVCVSVYFAASRTMPGFMRVICGSR